MEQGWVYVLVNPTLPGIVKVGRTVRLPSTRVAELSQATGVATPFILVFEQEFGDCISAEREIHASLDLCGMRVAPNREFFRGPTTEIVRLVLQHASETGSGAIVSPRSGLDLLHEGDGHLFGQNKALQNLPEALRCYQVAAARGSVLAFERLGVIMTQTLGLARNGRPAAMTYFKEGARRGNYYCHCEMASVAAEEGNLFNFGRSWDLFFLHRQSAWLGEAEEGAHRYPTALRRYLETCHALGLRPHHLPALRVEAAALLDVLHASLDQAINPAAAQHMLTASLHWTRQALVHVPNLRRHSMAGWELVYQLTARREDVAA